MRSGWIFNFKVNRRLTKLEHAEHLKFKKKLDFTPDGGSGLIKFNSTYTEYLDRRFKDKGELAVLIIFGAALFLFWFTFSFFNESSWVYIRGNLFERILTFVATVFIFGAGVFFLFLIKNDFFTFKYFPIRFNRNTKEIYIFHHNGPDGVLTLPWGDKRVFFHIGHGSYDKKIRDLRCHWMPDGPGGLIKETFVVGSYSDHENYVREEWELIRRYMEEGHEHCFDNEFDRVIDASPSTSWLCCYERALINLGPLISLRHVLFPLTILMTLSRWLTFKTCRKPVWPAEIEAECVIDPNDPYRLPEPDPRTGEHPLIEQNPGYLDRTLMRLKQRDAWYPESQARFAHLSPELKARAERAENACRKSQGKDK